jgi:Uma2 family endonuclease
MEISEVIKLKNQESSKRYTYNDYIRWEGSWELINGIPYSMTPAPSTQHQHIIGEVYFALRSHLGTNTCQVFVAPFDVRFSEKDEYENPETIVQPDISVVCNRNQLDSKGCKGAPALVVEVLSPSTALKDRNEKFELYKQHGVKEYWIIDPVHLTVEVYGETKEHFDNRKVFGGEHSLTSFLFKDFSLNLSDIFNHFN